MARCVAGERRAGGRRPSYARVRRAPFSLIMKFCDFTSILYILLRSIHTMPGLCYCGRPLAPRGAGPTYDSVVSASCGRRARAPRPGTGAGTPDGPTSPAGVSGLIPGRASAGRAGAGGPCLGVCLKYLYVTRYFLFSINYRNLLV